jgi:hypothetical protein
MHQKVIRIKMNNMIYNKKNFLKILEKTIYNFIKIKILENLFFKYISFR